MAETWTARPPAHTAPMWEPAARFSSTAAQVPPGRLGPGDYHRLSSAAGQAVLRYPGAVGQLLARELCSWAQLPYLFDHDGLMGRVVAELLDE